MTLCANFHLHKLECGFGWYHTLHLVSVSILEKLCKTSSFERFLNHNNSIYYRTSVLQQDSITLFNCNQ